MISSLLILLIPLILILTVITRAEPEEEQFYNFLLPIKNLTEYTIDDKIILSSQIGGYLKDKPNRFIKYKLADNTDSFILKDNSNLTLLEVMIGATQFKQFLTQEYGWGVLDMFIIDKKFEIKTTATSQHAEKNLFKTFKIDFATNHVVYTNVTFKEDFLNKIIKNYKKKA